MESQFKPYNGPWHAFYSQKSVNMENEVFSRHKKKNSTYFYKKNATNEIIEITSVFSTEKFANPDNCPYYFDDKVYLGIVDKFVRKGY
tara:strand:- start:95 stop:358 length:264 start_codon:yes stop_codon:yes gene_type:complete